MKNSLSLSPPHRPPALLPSLTSQKPISLVSSSQTFEITPKEVFIENIIPRQSYQAIVLIRNLSKFSRRVRITQPKTFKFKCDYDMKPGIAAGLAMTLVVFFETDFKGDFHDVIKITSDDKYEYELKIHALQPKSKIFFDQFLNLGFCKLSQSKEDKITFRNEGSNGGKVELRTDAKDLRLEPNIFHLNKGEVCDVKFIFTPKDNGILRTFVEVILDGLNYQKNIEVTATSIDFAKFLIDKNGAKLETIDFGPTYFGQRKEIKTFLINNTPLRLNFKAKFRNGVLTEQGEIVSLLTPNEVGSELTEKIVSCYPEEGVLESYSQIPVSFSCKSRVPDKVEFYAKKFTHNIKDENSRNLDILPEENFSYSAFFEFDGKNSDPIIIFLNVKGVCPQIKLSQTELNFFECPMNEKRDILVNIENKNEEVPIEYNFDKLPYFFVKPDHATLLPNQSSTFTVSFSPKSLGEFYETLNLNLLGGTYKIPLKIKAKSSNISRRSLKTRGPEGLDQDFEESKNFIMTDIAFFKKKKGDRLIFTRDSKFSEGYVEMDNDLRASGEDFYKIMHNKRKYNMFLQETRQSRTEKKRETEYNRKVEELERKMFETKSAKSQNESNGSKNNLKEKDESKSNLPPLDYQFIMGSSEDKFCQRLVFEKRNDTLFVTKPVDKYEPIIHSNVQFFNPDPMQKVKKKFPSEPKSHAEIRDCSQELTGIMLQKIYAGPVELDFKSIYVKSQETRTFFVRNDLRSSILVKLIVENEELKASYQIPQMIPSSQVAGFDIIFLSSRLQQFKGFIKYVINDRHIFEFKVLAKVDPVKIDLSVSSLDFKFDESSLELISSQVIHLSNKGNSPGKFKWTLGDQKIFSVRPSEGEVPAQGKCDVWITYKPAGNAGVKAEEEKLKMKVEDGIDEIVECKGFTKEVRCAFRQEKIDLGVIPICKKIDNIFISLKNIYKNPAVYHVAVERLPPYTEVTPVKDRLAPDETKFLKVTFMCKEEKKIESEIILNIRGGKPVCLPFKAETIIPKVSVLEDEFDFGGVTTLGNSSNLKMTIINNSDIPATLLLDLREKDDGPIEYEGVECLDITSIRNEENDESSIIESIPDENEVDGPNLESPLNSNIIEDIDKQSHISDDSIDQAPKASSRYYKITAHPGVPLFFHLRFSPKDVRNYNLELPLTLKGFGRINALAKPIICKGLKPKFLLQPQLIEFKRKIITAADKAVPDVVELTISNPDSKAIFWKIDQSKSEDKTFFFVPSENRIESGQTQIIKACFNPSSPNSYERTFPLFISNDQAKPYLEITMKGLGTYPKITFDRRDIILPVVPLDITSKCTFKIFNDGYDNMALKEKVIEEFRKLNLKIKYLDGRTLGITKSKLNVEVSFSSKTPLSFTTRIEFYDENGKVYVLPISGTADNCLMTNYTYFQTHMESDYEIIGEEGKPLTLIERNEDFFDDEEKTPQQASFVKKGSVASFTKSSKSAFGFEPIPKHMLDRSCDLMMRWLNYTALTSNIQSFPDDVVALGGSQIFELIFFLTGKTLPFKVKFDSTQKNMKKIDKTEILIKQYVDLIKYLKENGGLLNHIRPQYLLSFADYNAYVKTQTNDFFNPSTLKITEARYNYVSQDSWLTVFYQTLKIFYLSRINLKSFRSMPGLPPDKIASLPDALFEGSNFLSSNEIVLLKWMELNFEQVFPENARKLINFASDLRGCLPLVSVIQNYLGPSPSKVLKNIRTVCSSEDDLKINAEKILAAFNEIGMQTYTIARDFLYPSQREMLLFIINLWNNMPCYIPKNEPIKFNCALGEESVQEIELKNNTTKNISYWVKYEGSPDFYLERDNITIEAKKSIKYKVKFISRLSKTQTGRLTFTNKKEGNTNAGALVFDLQSNVISRKSVEEHHVGSKLYKLEDCKLPIKNIFTNSPREFGEFQITLQHEKVGVSSAAFNSKSKKNIKKKKMSAIENVASESSEENSLVIPPFFTMKEKIRIKRGEVGYCNIHFLPFTMETFKCFIIFCDPEVGEFQHTIIGQTDFPEPLGEPVKAPIVYIDTPQKFYFPLDYRNEILKEARKFHEQRLIQTGKMKEKELYLKALQKENNIESMAYEIEMHPESGSVQVPTSIVLYDKIKTNKKASILVSQTTNLSIQQKEIDKRPSKLKQEENNANNEFSLNSIPINLSFKVAYREYACSFLLRSQSKNDIRIYRLIITVHPKIVHAKLEFHIPIGEEIKQEIPFTNNSDKDWQFLVKQNFTQDRNIPIFFGGKDLIVRKRTTNSYAIIFRPISISRIESKLILTNNQTNEVFEYELIGAGDEPLAKDNIIMDCIAKNTTSKTIEVVNPYKDRSVTYVVETTLINPDGPPSFTIAPGKSYKYVLSVAPALGGLYTGSITFSEQEDKSKFVWYTVLLKTDRPKCEKTIDLTTYVRKSVVFDIELANPLRETIIFEIAIEGEGLHGSSSFALEPKQSGIYELAFLPLKAFKGKGSIAFMQEKLGEIWYDFNLYAEESPIQRSPTLKAELGKVAEWPVILENPSSEICEINYRISNPNNFDVYPENIKIQPFDLTKVLIKYIPSDLEVNETGEVIFESSKIGKWQFFVFGMGLPPTPFQPLSITGALNKDISSNITFKNPFKDQITASITIEYPNDSNRDALQLLIKKSKVKVQGLRAIQIPFSFTPKEIAEFKAEIIIYMNEKIQWKYPIVGITESSATKNTFLFKTKAREAYTTELRIVLPGLPKNMESQKFDLDIQGIDGEFEALLQKYLKISSISSSLSSGSESLIYHVSFTPQKPFKANFEIIISRPTGGRWKYKAFAEATEPDEDDILTIYSPMYATNSVCFRLTNRFKYSAAFAAYFTPDSDPEFSVMPKSGDLDPVGRDGKNFVVSFTPVSYVQMRKAKLIIETDELMWIYIIKGFFPEYKPPIIEQSRIESRTRLELRSAEKAERKNFLAENIKASKNSKNLLSTIDTNNETNKMKLSLTDKKMPHSLKKLDDFSQFSLKQQ